MKSSRVCVRGGLLFAGAALLLKCVLRPGIFLVFVSALSYFDVEKVKKTGVVSSH